MNAILSRITWADFSYVQNARHLELLEEMMRLDLMRKDSLRLEVNGRRFNVHLGDFDSLHWSRQFEWPWAIIEGSLSPNDFVLEAGGGSAVFQYALATRCQSVINVDNDPNVIQKLKDSERDNLYPHVEYICCDASSLPYDSETFDKAFCISVIEHTFRPLEVIKELYRVLKTGGKLICTVDVGCDIDLRSMADILGEFGIQIPPRTGDMLLNTNEDGKFIIHNGEINVLCFSIIKGES